LTSKMFLEKANLKLPENLRVVFLEDVRETITKKDRYKGLMRALLLTADGMETLLGRQKPAELDDVATLIFSSGSTGQPKGVMLTHWNLVSNCIGTVQYVKLPDETRLLGVLPFFHSFGYMATLWLPLIVGLGTSYYPNPLDARAIGAVVE